MSKKRFLPAILVVPAIALVAVLLVGTGSAAHKATFRAGLVSDVGRFNDKGFNQNQLTGLKAAQKQLGVQIRAIESHSAGDYIPNLASLARQRYDAVVAAGFLLANAEATVAKKFPNTQFAITDYPAEIPPFSDAKGKLLVKNITGITFRAEQQSYLVGCLSALMAKKGGGNTISAVGGVKIPPVDSFIAGYRAGAKKCVASIKVLIGYSQDFIAADKCKAVAANQIAAGSKVVFNVAGPCGLGALEAAKEQGVWGDGVDVDQSYLGPHILTSAVKRVDLGVFRFIQAVKDGTLVPGHSLVFDLKNGGVALGKISSKVPKAYVTKVNGLKEQIIAGKIKVPTAV
ncbi:MAG TPA: BMP family ABC transporter substrate-binding protein [Gaiellaceae bacterium]|nr:BMP family ABC transporter substrate-binding protein [Gaiellaceae bacterium]